jgi:tetratricopeptide (TPR) repeat protein
VVKLSSLLFVLLSVYALPAQTSTEAHQRIRAAYVDRDYLEALAQLRSLEAADPAAFHANNYDYLRARVAERTGDSGAAMADYQAIVSRGSVLKPYALWHLSQLARASGNLLLERLYLEELTSFASDSLLAPPAVRRLAQSWFESGNYDLAIRQLETSANPASGRHRSDSRSGDRGRTAFLAEAYLRSGNVAKGRELYGSLVANLPNPAQPDDHALAAARALDQLATGAGWSEKLSDYDLLRRATIYQFNRDFGQARLHYAAIIRDHPQSGIVPDAILQTGRGYVSEGEFSEALKWLERVLEQFPDHPAAEEALVQAASAYARLGKHHEAGVRYKKYIEKYPEGERLDRAYLNMIDVLRDEREETAALKWADRVREKFRGKQQESLAMFAQARIHLARSAWQDAVTVLEDLEKHSDLGTNAPGGTTIQEVRFLRGFALEHLRKYDDAIDVYLFIPDGRNEYYGWRATERLKLMASDPNTSSLVAVKATALRNVRSADPESQRRSLQSALRLIDSPDERAKILGLLRSVYAANPAYSSFPKFRLLPLGRQKTVDRRQDMRSKISDELLFLGLYDEAAPELESARGRSGRTPGKTDLDYTLAVFYTRQRRLPRRRICRVGLEGSGGL